MTLDEQDKQWIREQLEILIIRLERELLARPGLLAWMGSTDANLASLADRLRAIEERRR